MFLRNKCCIENKLTTQKKYVTIKVGKMKKNNIIQNAHRGENMKYLELFNKIKEQYSEKSFNKNDIEKIAIQVNNINSEKTIRNIIGIFKSHNLIKEISKNQYIVTNEKIYNYEIKENEKKIYKIIKNEYPEINFVIWNTEIINEFTLHYVVSNYIIIETEKIAIEAIVNLLKTSYLKKYTIITQDIFNNNRDIYDNTENLIIVKPLHIKSPIFNKNGTSVITLEKVMLDLYIDKLYLAYQGKELETIYENIFNEYDIELLKLMNYAKSRVSNIDEYKQFLNKLNIPEKYKIKE